MNINTKKLLGASVAAVLVANLAACGTIIHPERKGQINGKIDPAIAVLDAAGLLLWFIPGIVAFAVDFSTGAIYLPGGERAELSDEEMERIVDADGKVDQSKLKALVEEKSEHEQLDLSQFKVKSLESATQLAGYFKQPMHLAGVQ